MRHIVVTTASLAILTTCSSILPATAQEPAYNDPGLSIAQRVESLLSQMTLEEKLAQTFCFHLTREMLNDSGKLVLSPEIEEVLPLGVGQLGKPSWTFDRNARESAEIANTLQALVIEQGRLGIPAIFHEEGLHGLWARDATVFPQAIGMSCTWDPALVEEVFGVVAAEIRLRGSHQANTPMLDVVHDPRWGRIEESYGEDPFLTSAYAKAIVWGLQGRQERIDNRHIVATVKHFAGYGIPEGGLNKAPLFSGERALREVVLPPFRAAIVEAGALSLMPGYNEIDGIPNHANQWLLTTVLRNEWGFRGYVVSDYQGVVDLSRLHHVAADLTEAGRIAMLAGVDMELENPFCFGQLREAVHSDKELQQALDRAVRRILTVKLTLGLFDKPYVEPLEAAAFCHSTQNQQLSQRVAEEAVVLLKNERQLLPLDLKRYRRIAVIGPHANTVHWGGYSPKDTRHGITFFEGIRQYVGDGVEVAHAEGCRIHEGDGHWLTVIPDQLILTPPAENRERIKDAVQLAGASDLVLLAVGGTAVTCGEFLGDRHSLQLFGQQDELVEAILDTGVPTVVCLVNGRPLAITSIQERADAIVETWYLGERAGAALARVLFGAVTPGGKLTVSFPRSVGHVPAYYQKKPSASDTYLATETAPLYPFGFGLSYTTFAYSDLRLDPREIAIGESTEISFELTNTGECAGQETAQLYIRDLVSTVTRPVQELRGFRKLRLAPGQRQTVTLRLSTDDLRFYDKDMRYVVEPGEFAIMIGASSADIRLSGTLTVTAAR